MLIDRYYIQTTKCYICPSSSASSEDLEIIQSEKSEERFSPSRLFPQLSQEDMLKLEVFLGSSTQLGSWNATSKKIYNFIFLTWSYLAMRYVLVVIF